MRKFPGALAAYAFFGLHTANDTHRQSIEPCGLVELLQRRYTLLVAFRRPRFTVRRSGGM
jgi:hypothetical protein